MNEPSFFVTGGALKANAGSYVSRQADKMLIEALRKQEFCYVLTTRQMGKSSLMVRTAAQLRQEGYAVVILDLTAIGQNLNVEQWYFSMLCHVGEKLDLEVEMEEYWDANLRRAPLHRFMGALRDVYLAHRDKPLIVFVDEIDAVRSLRQFSADEFFAGIRECYNRRTEDPVFQRLTFCLLGVATPSDLIADQRMTPFNIGHPIDLVDFTDEDAAILAGGLSPHRATAHTLLARVLWWTRGQPFLTQKLCAEVAKGDHDQPCHVDEACARIFFTPEARERDDNLHFVRDRLLRSEEDRAALLDVYAKVCRGERVPDDHLNSAIAELRLSGVVRIVDGHLKARNPIYARVFDTKWVRANLPDAEARRQRAAFYRGVRRVAGVAMVVLTIMGALVVKIHNSAQSEKAARVKAEEAGQQAEKARESEKAQTEKAQQEALRAEQSTQREREAKDRTKDALDQIVGTQGKVQELLEALIPFVGEKSGQAILNHAEDVVHSAERDTTADPRLVLGLAGLRCVCSRLYLRFGNEGSAVNHAQAARRLIEEQLRQNADDPDLAKTKQLHECLVVEGDAILGGPTRQSIKQKSEAEYAQGVADLDAAMNLARKLYAAHPQDSKIRQMYFTDVMTLGDTAKLSNRTLDAEKRYQEALAAVDQGRRTHEDEDFCRIEAAVHDRLGMLFLELHYNTDAGTEFENAQKLRDSHPGKGPDDDPERQSELAASYNQLGDVYLTQDKLDEAFEYFQRSLVIRRKLCEHSKQREWQCDLFGSLYNTANARWKKATKERPPSTQLEPLEIEAQTLAEDCLKKAEEMFNEDTNDPQLRLDYARGLYLFADTLLNVQTKELQQWPEARRLAKKAVGKTERRNPRLLGLLAQALRLNKDAPDPKDPNDPKTPREMLHEALNTAEEASKLLPPSEKQTADEQIIAAEIAYEISKSKAELRKIKDDTPPRGKRTDSANRASPRRAATTTSL